MKWMGDNRWQFIGVVIAIISMLVTITSSEFQKNLILLTLIFFIFSTLFISGFLSSFFKSPNKFLPAKDELNNPAASYPQKEIRSIYTRKTLNNVATIFLITSIITLICGIVMYNSLEVRKDMEEMFLYFLFGSGFMASFLFTISLKKSGSELWVNTSIFAALFFIGLIKLIYTSFYV